MHVRDSVNHKNKVLEVDGSNQLSVKDVTAQGSLSTISAATANISADQATATNQTAANSSLSNTSSKSAGDLSVSVDGNSQRKCSIFGTCSINSGSVKVHISNDNVNFYEDNQAQFYANYSNGHLAGSFDVNARYFKVEFMDTATYTLEYAMCD